MPVREIRASIVFGRAQRNAAASDRLAPVRIRLDDLSSPQVHALLQEHLDQMLQKSPRESVHALDVAALRQPDISFWTVWGGSELLGCGALKRLGSSHGEIKSMRTASAHLRKGVGRAVLDHIVHEARARGYRRLSLETGSLSAFEPARRLYEAFGFAYCAPFADYRIDPHSVYMTLEL
jgi:putative acetyltransferase